MKNIEQKQVIETLLKSHAGYTEKIATEKSVVLSTLLDTHSHFLFQTYQLHKPQWEQEFKDDFSILLGGDKLHLSSAYREEHVTAWLKWVLEAPPLNDKEQAAYISAFLCAIMSSEAYRMYGAKACNDFKLAPPVLFRTEVSLERESRIDLLIESKDTVVLIENKIGDMSLEKNKRYKKLADKMWPRKTIIPILVLPQESLESFSSSASKDEVSDVLAAFPPATWETVLNSLRVAIDAFESKSPIYLLWKANIYSFMSFVEGNVLGYDLGKIRRILLRNSQPSQTEISEFSRYRKYRKGE